MASHCPAEGVAIKKCPFLHNVAQTQGESYASSLLSKPACPFGHGATQKPALPEDGNFGPTFALFHGKNGVLPLPHLSRPAPEVLYPVEAPTPAQPQPVRPCAVEAIGSSGPRHSMPLFAGAPLASMSMSWGSNWFNIHHLFQQHLQQHRAQQRKPPQQPQHQAPSPNAPGGAMGPGPMGGPGAHASSSLHGAGGTGGTCPMRRALGPFAGVIFNKNGHLACPEPIMKMRAALAATRPVRELRPQALPVKLLAIALTTTALNVPCGMWREHTKKFSSQWFVAVHATIPFIAMLRKAVIMPKYAILFTICAAIAGQAMGAKMERKRMLAAAKEELAGLTKAKVVVVGPPPPVRAPAAASAMMDDVMGMEEPAPLPVASLLMARRRRPSVAAAPPPPPPPSSLAAWMAQEEAGTGAGATAAKEGKERLQFRVRMRSGRRIGGGGGVGLLGRGLRGGAGPAVAMLPSAPVTAVAC